MNPHGLRQKLVSLKSKDFPSFFKTAKKVSSTYFIVFIKPNSVDLTRLGIVIKRKCVKTAVKRNKIKRIIREFFRSKLPFFKGVDFIVLVHRPQTNETIHSLRRDLEKQCSRLRKCC